MCRRKSHDPSLAPYALAMAVLDPTTRKLAQGANFATFTVHLSCFDEVLPAAPAESAAAINRAMERLIVQCPQQYLWGYARYKAPRRLSAGVADDRLLLED